MCRLTIIGLASWMAITAAEAEAQFVRTGAGGGVVVRAPFVHVEVGPGGGTHVRAPFTSVVAPGYGRSAARYVYPTGHRSRYGMPGQSQPISRGETARSTPTSPEQMNWLDLRRHAREVSLRLENELRQVADGTLWSSSLRPGTIRDLVAVDSDQPPGEDSVGQLAAILDSYDGLVQSNAFPRIVELTEFQRMRQTLVELVSPPSQRTRRTLATHWKAFDSDLERFGLGESWREYLALPPGVAAAGEDATSPGASREPAGERLRKQLEELETRYEEVVGPDGYRTVAKLASFKETRRQLAGYVELLRADAADSGSKVSQPEMIPTPRPLP